jgi:hypothetical protein
VWINYWTKQEINVNLEGLARLQAGWPSHPVSLRSILILSIKCIKCNIKRRPCPSSCFTPWTAQQIFMKFSLNVCMKFKLNSIIFLKNCYEDGTELLGFIIGGSFLD